MLIEFYNILAPKQLAAFGSLEILNEPGQHLIAMMLECEIYPKECFYDLRFGDLHGRTAPGIFIMCLADPVGGAAGFLSLTERAAMSAYDLP